MILAGISVLAMSLSISLVSEMFDEQASKIAAWCGTLVGTCLIAFAQLGGLQ